ncbi:Fc.00g012520.m01.CDS01 [Cosmosporella sp. VM-42]
MQLRNVLVGAAVAGASSLPKHINVRLMSYNIQQAVEDEMPGGELWSVRRPLMTSQLKYETSGRPDTIMCFQEADEQQTEDLQADLGNDWAYIGGSRKGSNHSTEFSPIFYRPDVWEATKNTTLWLSETPEKPASRSWNNSSPRTMTVAQFEHVDSGTPLVYMCTHFDPVSMKARVESAELIVETAKEWARKGRKFNVFVGGDFKSREYDLAYTILEEKMHDVEDLVPRERRFGHIYTFTNFTVDRADDEIIDHIFVDNEAGLEWNAFTILNNRFDDRVFISDHRPVVVDFKMLVKNKREGRGD